MTSTGFDEGPVHSTADAHSLTVAWMGGAHSNARGSSSSQSSRKHGSCAGILRSRSFSSVTVEDGRPSTPRTRHCSTFLPPRPLPEPSAFQATPCLSPIRTSYTLDLDTGVKRFALLADFRRRRASELQEDAKREYPELHTAVRLLETATVEMLLNQDLRERNQAASAKRPLAQFALLNGETALHLVSSMPTNSNPDAVKIARMLLADGAPTSIAAINGRMPLHEAVQAGNEPM